MRYKILLGVVLVCGLWQLWQDQAIADAVLAFCFGGVVPGSRIVLSPTTMLLGVIIGLAVLAATLLLRPLRPLQLPRPADRAIDEAPVAASLDILPRRPTSRRRWTGFSRAAAWRTKRWLHSLELGRRQGLRRAKAAGGVGYRRLQKLAVIAWREARKASLALWRWAAPYLWQFDSWLQQQVNGLSEQLRRRARRHDNIVFMLAIGRECKNAAGQFRLTGLRLAAKQQLRKLRTKP